MRKLASIQTISAIDPLPDSDNLEVATVLGWKVVVRKDEKYQVGDLVVYFEVDSFLPIDPRFEFLRKSCHRQTPWQGEGFRLKTMKIRGQVSQGLVLRLREFPEILADPSVEDKGADVTAVLRVTKWDPPESIPRVHQGQRTALHGNIKGSRPSWVPKTDETRIQSIPWMLEHFVGKTFYSTMKLDGCSTSIFCKDGLVGGCSRNNEIKTDEDNLLTRLITKYNLDTRLPVVDRFSTTLHRFPMNIVLQGELCGPGIQKNLLGLREYEWFVFDAIDLDTGVYFDFPMLLELARVLDLRMVPILESGVFTTRLTLDVLVKEAENYVYPNTSNPAEGVVFRTQTPAWFDGERSSFKVLNNKYLLDDRD